MNVKDMIEERINRKKKKQKAKIIVKVTTGAMTAIAAGVVGGFLISLKSKKEIRGDIAKTAKIKETFDKKIVDTKNNLTTAKDKINKYLEDTTEKNNNKKEDEAVAIKYQLNFRNIYSRRIYHYLKSCESCESRDKDGTSCQINSLNVLRDKFGCSKTYERYSDFKRSILKPAYEEINRDSDISFEFEEIKIKNKVTSLKFYIKFNNYIKDPHQI